MSDYEPIKTFQTLDSLERTTFVCDSEVPGTEARFAMALVERWGMVAGENNGEDSAGRSRLRLATPDELTDRAIAVTEALFSKMRGRGWFTPIEPSHVRVLTNKSEERVKRLEKESRE